MPLVFPYGIHLVMIALALLLVSTAALIFEHERSARGHEVRGGFFNHLFDATFLHHTK